MDPKAGRHDELGQAIIPPLIETQRECILVENSSSQKGGKKKTLKARPGQEAKHRKHCRLSRPALSRATCNGIARGEARRAATGVPEKSSSREGTLHHITSVTTSPAQSVVTCSILWMCALLEYWTLLTHFAISYLCSAEAETMASAPPDAGRQVRPLYIDTYIYVSMHVYVHYYCLHTHIYRCMYTCSAI